MRQTSFASVQCSLARSLDLIGDWWTPLILRDINLGIERFDDLAEDLGISRNLLTSRLGHLTRSDIVARRRYSEHPPRYHYVLTDAGRALMPVLAALTAWGDRFAAPEGGAPIVFRHRGCGHVCTPTVCCDACGEPIRNGGLEALPGPGARSGPGTRLLARMLTAKRAVADGAAG
jgi:DNA-binding HxlR family transcriptional regulator